MRGQYYLGSLGLGERRRLRRARLLHLSLSTLTRSCSKSPRLTNQRLLSPVLANQRTVLPDHTPHIVTILVLLSLSVETDLVSQLLLLYLALHLETFTGHWRLSRGH